MGVIQATLFEILNVCLIFLIFTIILLLLLILAKHFTTSIHVNDIPAAETACARL